ncbi:MAG: efflux RND transporter periplasmic adaptor subunit [Chloroflexi bacterium]|nr:efflux RND transporter periplasmic adaptor subunit [Chloroflexota bacterium]
MLEKAGKDKEQDRDAEATANKDAKNAKQQAKANLADLKSPNTDQLAAAQAQVEQARLTWEQAKVNLDNARIVAPFDGYVTKVNATAGAAGGPTTTIELADLSRYYLDVLIDETEIGKVQPDQAVEVEFDALPNSQLTGRVTRIDPAGTINQGVINYRARIDLDPTPAPVRLEMTGDVRIIHDTHAQVLAVPTVAIRTDEATGESYVELANLPQQDAASEQDSTAQRVTVTTGITDGELTEVTGQLQAGQRIFISEAVRLPRGPGGFGGFPAPPAGLGQ